MAPSARAPHRAGNRGNHINLFPERGCDRLSDPRGLAWGLGRLGKSTHVGPHSTAFEQCMECAPGRYVSAGRADGTTWEKPSSVSTAIKTPSAATLGRTGDTPREEAAHDED